FADVGVGYVSAPSICAANGAENWAARTRLHTESGFHGILQSGYSNGFAPMCIGSHYAVRTAALQAAGGLGPELAEDHSTTMVLNAAGWRGMHAIDAIAIGDGPATVPDMVIQEFQWSRSLVTLLLQHTGRYLPGLTPRLRRQFLFCQLLYPVLALTYLAIYLLPIAALLGDFSYAAVTYPQFLLHAGPGALAMLLIAVALKRAGHFRPVDAAVLSWERILFVALQWPWVLWGCAMAMRDAITRSFVDFRITPKGDAARGRLPVKVLLVYTALTLGCIAPVLTVRSVDEAKGFLLLTLLSGLLYAATVLVTIWHHLSENGWRFAGSISDAAMQAAIVVAVIGLFSTAVFNRSVESMSALALGLEPLKLVETQVNIAGAGSGAGERFSYQLTFAWEP
ncbi:MAG: glycosyltransferase family 2 protein, partial [Paracoccaceae bacterium]